MNEISACRHNGEQPGRAVAGIYGLGGAWAGDNPTLKAWVTNRGGRMFHAWQKRKIRAYLARAAAEGQELAIYGYSRGGDAAIKIANALGRRKIRVAVVVTFDPYSFFDNSVLRFKYDNVVQAVNFVQRNRRTAGRFGWWGSNPYWGSHVESPFIEVREIDFTGQCDEKGAVASHLNIVRQSLAYLSCCGR